MISADAGASKRRSHSRYTAKPQQVHGDATASKKTHCRESQHAMVCEATYHGVFLTFPRKAGSCFLSPSVGYGFKARYY